MTVTIDLGGFIVICAFALLGLGLLIWIILRKMIG